jgi:hypothetical protein
MLAWRKAVSKGRDCWLVRKRMACSCHGTRRARRANSICSAVWRASASSLGKGVSEDFCALSFLRPELFGPAAGVVLDDGVGGGKDGGGGAVILLEADDFDLGKMLFHVKQIGDLRAAPAVNALVVVAHHAKIAVDRSQMVDKLELRPVGVLVFVHHHVFVFVAA